MAVWQNTPQEGGASARRGYGLGEIPSAAPPTLATTNSSLLALVQRLDSHYEMLRRMNPHDVVARTLGGAPDIRPPPDNTKGDGIVQMLHIAMDAIEGEVNSLGNNVERLRNEL